jgi:hypothetical protein
MWEDSAHDENKIWKDRTVQFWTQSILPSKESLPCSGKTVLSAQTSPSKHCMHLKFYQADIEQENVQTISLSLI